MLYGWFPDLISPETTDTFSKFWFAFRLDINLS